MKQLELTVTNRTETGRGPVRRLRASGKVPAVIYGKSGSRPLTLEEPQLRKLMRAISGAAAIVKIKDDANNESLSIIQEVMRDPVTDRFEHVDFHEVSATEKMHAVLPVHIKGEAAGVKNENGVIDFVAHQVDIECLPKDLPEFIDLDISSLSVGESIHIKDLPSISGVKILNDAESVVVACVAPTKVEEAESAQEEGEETPEAEGESSEGEKSENDTEDKK